MEREEEAFGEEVRFHWVLLREAQRWNKSYVLFDEANFARAGVDIATFDRDASARRTPG